MEIKVDDEVVYTLSEIQSKVIQNEVLLEIYDEDMKRRARWVWEHKYERCFDRLKKEWDPKLRARMPSIPTDPEEYASLVFAQPDYKNRSEREEAEQERLASR